MGFLFSTIGGCLSLFGIEFSGLRSLLLLATFVVVLGYSWVWWASTQSDQTGTSLKERERAAELAQTQQSVVHLSPKGEQLPEVAAKLISPGEVAAVHLLPKPASSPPPPCACVGSLASLGSTEDLAAEEQLKPDALPLWTSDTSNCYLTDDKYGLLSCQDLDPTIDAACDFDDIWQANGSCMGAEATITADANSVLESALVSGSAKLADAALATGVRLCSSTWLAKACGQLQAVGIPLMPERALELVRIFGQDHRADLAVDLWHAQCAELGMDPSHGLESEPPPCPELYSAVLETCARAGDFETAAQAASSTGWRVPLCRHGQVAFLALSRWYARRQDVSRSMMCYDAVRAVSGCADLATHRAALVASVRSGDMLKADMLFQDLVSSGITPDGATYSAMICGYCSAGDVEKAMQYFTSLRQRGIVPAAPLFDAILDGCALMNMPSLIEQVLAEMEATGVRPSTSTLAILVRLHGMNRDTEQALAVFDELPKKHGLKLDGHAYGTLISVCLKNDSYGMAWNAFERMSKAGCRAHARIYEAVITASLRQGQLDNAVHAVYEALGIPPVELDESAIAVLRMRLQPKVIEDVLRLIGRRRQTSRLGAPLLRRLQAVGIEISEDLAAAVLQNAEPDSELLCSELHRRRALHQSWRNLREDVTKGHVSDQEVQSSH
jgi:pentatricopeptide repeat protein|mmetsp:Transcript_108330/g.170849  ORF Transcript_108330/g.170849 Transcript_108330/m.170849 type:complete len:671 (+) Transcript_108330:182-2194(+)